MYLLQPQCAKYTSAIVEEWKINPVHIIIIAMFIVFTSSSRRYVECGQWYRIQSELSLDSPSSSFSLEKQFDKYLYQIWTSKCRYIILWQESVVHWVQWYREWDILVVVWHTGSTLVSINEVNLWWARLVPGRVTVSGFNSRCQKFTLVSNQLPRSTQPGHPFVGRRNEHQPKGGDALWQSKGRYGSFLGGR